MALAALVGQTMYALQHRDETEAPDEAPCARRDETKGPPLRVRHYATDHSVFIDGEYLIKGVAGAVFWAIVPDHANDARSDLALETVAEHLGPAERDRLAAARGDASGALALAA